MKIIRSILIFCLLCTLSVAGHAETEDTSQRFSPQEFMKRQEAFIVREARLSPTEAAAFFPLMREKEAKDRAIRTQMDAIIKKSHNDDLSDKECREILDKMADLDLQKAKLENVYRLKYRKVLNPKKILRVLDANGRFDREMLKHMLNRQWKRPHNQNNTRNQSNNTRK